jgi:AmpE protein
MSLISLLIALAAERYLSSPFWQFKTYYQRYLTFVNSFSLLEKSWQNTAGTLLFILAPVLVVYGVLTLIDDSLLHLIFSTVILIVCFGSFATRESYKNYLMSAFRGEQTTCQLHHEQLLQDKNLPKMGFGQALIWLNYRYYIAIMLFFIVFGAAGVVFYRLLVTLVEKQKDAVNNQSSSAELDAEKAKLSEQQHILTVVDEQVYCVCQQLLFWLDWLPVRITSFGYMLVGHFSKALPVWLESFFEVNKPLQSVLGDVAQKSEDMMIDDQDCTAEPCLLVRLAKRNVLLLLAVVSILTLSGLIS